MTNYSVEAPLPGRSFGCVIRRLTMSHLEDADNRSILKNLFIKWGVLVFLESEVTDALHLSVSRVFGDLSIHPLAAEIGVPGSPELIRLHYDRQDATIVDVDGRLIGGYVPWHFDGVFVQRINRGGILRLAHKPEKGGGATGFMDGIDAHDRLPERLKQQLAGLEAIYQLDSSYPYLPRNTIRIVEQGSTRDTIMARKDRGEFPPVTHPIVITQAETGRKVLHFSPMYAQGIVGMSESEAAPILRKIAEYVTDERFAYFHDWQSDGELVLWDNWRLLHKASGIDRDDNRAVVRTTIAGDYGLGRMAKVVATS